MDEKFEELQHKTGYKYMSMTSYIFEFVPDYIEKLSVSDSLSYGMKLQRAIDEGKTIVEVKNIYDIDIAKIPTENQVCFMSIKSFNALYEVAMTREDISDNKFPVGRVNRGVDIKFDILNRNRVVRTGTANTRADADVLYRLIDTCGNGNISWELTGELSHLTNMKKTINDKKFSLKALVDATKEILYLDEIIKEYIGDGMVPYTEFKKNLAQYTKNTPPDIIFEWGLELSQVEEDEEATHYVVFISATDIDVFEEQELIEGYLAFALAKYIGGISGGK